MLVLPVFLTRHSSIKVRRENDCKDKTQILKIRKNQLILLNFNDSNRSVYQISIYSYLLARIFNPYPFRSNICFYVICCFFVFFFALFSTYGASSSCIFRSNAARQQAQGTYWIRYRRYETAGSFLTLHILHEDFVSATIQDI